METRASSCVDACRWTGFRSFTIANLLQLKQLDGTAVTPVERIQALRALPVLQEDLAKEIQRQEDAPGKEKKHRLAAKFVCFVWTTAAPRY